MTPLTNGYTDLLKGFSDRGYTAATFHDVEPEKPQVILRHDVDVSLERAVAMGREEADFGWPAVYFVLISTPFYNVLSNTAMTALRELRAQGHEIGLHLDFTSAYGRGERDDLQALADRQADILSNACGSDIRSLSFHRPATHGAGSNYADTKIDGYVSAYDRRFFKDMAYVSDSRGAWRYGHPLDHEAIARGRAMQLLTHPVWWTGGNHDTPAAALQKLQGERERDSRALMSSEFSVDRAQLSPSLTEA